MLLLLEHRMVVAPTAGLAQERSVPEAMAVRAPKPEATVAAAVQAMQAIVTTQMVKVAPMQPSMGTAVPEGLSRCQLTSMRCR
mmetsp:Transcript_53292/g.92948  ORF Transcript_53292/g.92948 Transcript_53292/m.92948 type:complete len:83 (-) Transcript_53292:173-421(-)